MKKENVIVVMSVCSMEAANNLEKIILEASLSFCMAHKACIYAGVEKKKTKDGVNVILSANNASFLFHVGHEIGSKQHTICVHNHKFHPHDVQAN